MSVGFIIKKFISLRGHMNANFAIDEYFGNKCEKALKFIMK